MLKKSQIISFWKYPECQILEAVEIPESLKFNRELQELFKNLNVKISLIENVSE